MQTWLVRVEGHLGGEDIFFPFTERSCLKIKAPPNRTVISQVIWLLVSLLQSSSKFVRFDIRGNPLEVQFKIMLAAEDKNAGQ